MTSCPGTWRQCGGLLGLVRPAGPADPTRPGRGSFTSFQAWTAGDERADLRTGGCDPPRRADRDGAHSPSSGLDAQSRSGAGRGAACSQASAQASAQERRRRSDTRRQGGRPVAWPTSRRPRANSTHHATRDPPRRPRREGAGHRAVARARRSHAGTQAAGCPAREQSHGRRQGREGEDGQTRPLPDHRSSVPLAERPGPAGPAGPAGPKTGARSPPTEAVPPGGSGSVPRGARAPARGRCPTSTEVSEGRSATPPPTAATSRRRTRTGPPRRRSGRSRPPRRPAAEARRRSGHPPRRRCA